MKVEIGELTLPPVKAKNFTHCGDHAPVDEVTLFIEKQQRKELLILQRSFRKLEMEHAPDKSMVVNQIKYELDEKEDLKLCLDLARGRYFTGLAESADQEVREMLERLAMQGDIAQACLEQIKESEKAMDTMVSRLYHFQLRWARQMTTASDTSNAYNKRLEKLNNRLNVAHINCNQLLHSNRLVRRDINELLIDRGLFHAISKRLQRQIYFIKLRQSRTVARAHQSYDVIEDCKYRVRLIMKHDDDFSRQHAIEIAEQKRSVDEVMKMRKFEAAKTKVRPSFESEQLRRVRHSKILAEKYGLLSYRYQLAFRRLLKDLPSLRTEMIIKYYQSLEESNFTLWRRNADLTAEGSKMLMDIDALHLKNLKLKEDSKVKRDAMKKRLKQLTKLSERNQKMVDYWSRMWSLQQLNMSMLLEWISEFCDTIAIEKSAVFNLLGRHTRELGPRNLSFIFQTIERRIFHILAAKSDLENTLARQEKRLKLPKVGLRDKAVNSGGPFAPNVFMTSHHPADNEDQDVEERLFSAKVFTKDDMREYCYERVKAVSEDREVYASVPSNFISRLSIRNPKLSQ